MNENQFHKDSIVSQAVGKAIALGRPFDDHWYYHTTVEDRAYFTSVHEFVLECDLRYRAILTSCCGVQKTVAV